MSSGGLVLRDSRRSHGLDRALRIAGGGRGACAVTCASLRSVVARRGMLHEVLGGKRVAHGGGLGLCGKWDALSRAYELTGP